MTPLFIEPHKLKKHCRIMQMLLSKGEPSTCDHEMTLRIILVKGPRYKRVSFSNSYWSWLCVVKCWYSYLCFLPLGEIEVQILSTLTNCGCSNKSCAAFTPFPFWWVIFISVLKEPSNFQLSRKLSHKSCHFGVFCSILSVNCIKSLLQKSNKNFLRQICNCSGNIHSSNQLDMSKPLRSELHLNIPVVC